jgi:hypothetical protein
MAEKPNMSCLLSRSSKDLSPLRTQSLCGSSIPGNKKTEIACGRSIEEAAELLCRSGSL